jgi:DNA replication and repair protein RecF
MFFELLRVNNVRNITSIQLEPNPLLNVVVGPNASGKTALLEAIHILARAKSFRTPRIKDVIKHTETGLQVVAEVSNKQSNSITTGIEKSHGSTLIKYKGLSVKTVSTQANNIPLILITPDSHNLITGSPKQRRHWLDWAMFHVEHSYLQDWKAYQKALRNRNILLKAGADDKQISAWENSMSKTGLILDRLRLKFIKTLDEQFKGLDRSDFSTKTSIGFYKGYPEEIDFGGYLCEKREQDRKLGYTKYGPHKADVLFLAEEHSIGKVYSRGQIKRFVSLVLLAEAKTYELINKEKPVFLIDDYAAELDINARKDLLESVLDYGGQIFITSTEEDKVLSQLTDYNLFHVERGSFHKVVK